MYFGKAPFDSQAYECVFRNARFGHQTVIPIDRKWRESCVIVDKTKKQFFSALI